MASILRARSQPDLSSDRSPVPYGERFGDYTIRPQAPMEVPRGPMWAQCRPHMGPNGGPMGAHDGPASKPQRGPRGGIFLYH